MSPEDETEPPATHDAQNAYGHSAIGLSGADQAISVGEDVVDRWFGDPSHLGDLIHPQASLTTCLDDRDGRFQNAVAAGGRLGGHAHEVTRGRVDAVER
jgi:hypothetical protein